MKKQVAEIIEKVANENNVYVSYVNTTGIYNKDNGMSHVEFNIDTRTWMDYDFYFQVWYHPSDTELSEVCEEVNEYWKDFDADQEAKTYIRYNPNSPYTTRQIIEEFEKIDGILEKFVNAMYETRNQLS